MRDGGHQPYRRGPREQGTALERMVMGKPLGMPNPMDAQRQVQKGASAAPSRQGTFLSDVLMRMAAKHAARNR